MASRRNLVKSFFRVFSYRMRCIKGETRYAPGFGDELGVALFKCFSLSQPHRGRCCYAGRYIPRADRTGARGVAQGKGDQSAAEAFCRRQIRRGRNSFPSGAMASTWITSRPGSPDGHLGDAIHMSCLTSHRCKGRMRSSQDLHQWSFQKSPITSRIGRIAGSKRVTGPQAAEARPEACLCVPHADRPKARRRLSPKRKEVWRPRKPIESAEASGVPCVRRYPLARSSNRLCSCVLYGCLPV